VSSSSSLPIRSWFPTPEQEAYLRSIDATRRYLQNLPAEVLQEYAGEWIAAKDGEIVSAAPTRAELGKGLANPDDPLVLKLRLEKGLTIRWRHRL
jgi:hypothetical protein